MIDHLVVLEAPPDLSVIGIDLFDPGSPMIGQYQGARVDVIKVTIFRTETTEDIPAETAPGFWLCIRAEHRLDLPWPFVTITDSDRAGRGEPFVVEVGQGWEWSQLTGRVAPVWAGTDYPFGPGMGPGMLVT